ncbi:hypothetical protein OESDEN_06154 [Oesophagostomum dentatum]|uniref:Uncharacterized protein n=1 Tax=Oesophagostomum dentatum TaxID=61180 RepID=A0A0B1T8L5_OESDE|nr:hypothetical protein OESDEN_06154 [Oesophagostomum dentatum]
MKYIVLLALVACAGAISIKECYENWNRCTPQTKFLTGPIWKSCADYCSKCLGKEKGECVTVENKKCSGGYQCSLAMNHFVLIALIVCAVALFAEAGCYKNWSRCTPQTAFWTGILWKSCPDFCRQCRGRASGSCVKVYNRACSGGYQCQCHGRSIKKSTNPLVIATCALGL